MDIDTLISLVHRKPPVWDRQDKKHLNRHVTDKCWRDISAAMNEDEYKLRKKWKYLRDQFAIEYGRIPTSEDEDSTSYEPKWPYFRSLTFLKDNIKPRKATENLIISLKRPSPSSSTDKTRKKKIRALSQNMVDIERKNLECLQRNANEDDEHLLFLKSLLPHIRKIPEERLLSFRNEILKIVDSYVYQSQYPGFTSSALSSCSPECTVRTVLPMVTLHTPEPSATQSEAQLFESEPEAQTMKCEPTSDEE